MSNLFGTPRFTHDCDRCRFLGQSGDADLYFCASQLIGGATVSARRSSEGSDYSSGMCFSFGQNAALTEARHRAEFAGLLAYPLEEALNYVKSDHTAARLELKKELQNTLYADLAIGLGLLLPEKAGAYPREVLKPDLDKAFTLFSKMANTYFEKHKYLVRLPAAGSSEPGLTPADILDWYATLVSEALKGLGIAVTGVGSSQLAAFQMKLLDDPQYAA